MTDHEKPPPRSTPSASKFYAVDGGRAPGQSSWLGPEESSELESWFQEDEAQDPEAVRDEMNKTRTLEFPPWLLRLAVLYGEGRLAGTRTEGRRGVEESGRVRPSAGRRGSSTTTHPALPRNVRGALSDTTLEPLSQRSEAPLVLERDAVPVRSYRSRVLGVGVALFAVSVGLVIVVVRPEGASRPELSPSAHAPGLAESQPAVTDAPSEPQRRNPAVLAGRSAASSTGSGSLGMLPRSVSDTDSTPVGAAVEKSTPETRTRSTVSKAPPNTSQNAERQRDGTGSASSQCEGKQGCATADEETQPRPKPKPTRVDQQAVGDVAPF